MNYRHPDRPWEVPVDSLSAEPNLAPRTPRRERHEGRWSVAGNTFVSLATTEGCWSLVETPPPRGQRSIESP
jgi:hypothetical protein